MTYLVSPRQRNRVRRAAAHSRLCAFDVLGRATRTQSGSVNHHVSGIRRRFDTSDEKAVISDFRLLPESTPGLYLLLTCDLTIVAASDACLRATMSRREMIPGRGLFNLFPVTDDKDDLDNPSLADVRNLKTSSDRVRIGREADAMAVQNCDIGHWGSKRGAFEERFWSPVDRPVFGTDGELACILRRVEDVTGFSASRMSMRKGRI